MLSSHVDGEKGSMLKYSVGEIRYLKSGIWTIEFGGDKEVRW